MPNHLIVTFDLKNAKSGDRRYAAVDKVLEDSGQLHKVFKQVRLLTTTSDPQSLAREVSDIIGPLGSVMICHAARPYRFVLGDQNPIAVHRVEMEEWFRGA